MKIISEQYLPFLTAWWSKDGIFLIKLWRKDEKERVYSLDVFIKSGYRNPRMVPFQSQFHGNRFYSLTTSRLNFKLSRQHRSLNSLSPLEESFMNLKRSVDSKIKNRKTAKLKASDEQCRHIRVLWCVTTFMVYSYASCASGPFLQTTEFSHIAPKHVLRYSTGVCAGNQRETFSKPCCG